MLTRDAIIDTLYSFTIDNDLDLIEKLKKFLHFLNSQKENERYEIFMQAWQKYFVEISSLLINAIENDIDECIEYIIEDLDKHSNLAIYDVLYRGKTFLDYANPGTETFNLLNNQKQDAELIFRKLSGIKEYKKSNSTIIHSPLSDDFYQNKDTPAFLLHWIAHGKPIEGKPQVTRQEAIQELKAIADYNNPTKSGWLNWPWSLYAKSYPAWYKAFENTSSDWRSLATQLIATLNEKNNLNEDKTEQESPDTVIPIGSLSMEKLNEIIRHIHMSRAADSAGSSASPTFRK